MCLNNISYSDIQHLQEPEQLFAYADAYRSAAATMCQQMTSDAARSTWPNAVVVLMLTAHAVELFLKGALLKRPPAEPFRITHDIDFLSEIYRLQFDGPLFEWDIPFNSGLTDAKRIELMTEAFPSLTESKIKEMSKEMSEKQATRRPPSIVYRYPTDKSGTEWRGNEGFKPHSFLSLLDQVENDFKRIKSNLD